MATGITGPSAAYHAVTRCGVQRHVCLYLYLESRLRSSTLEVCAFTNAEEKAAGALEWVESHSFLMETRFKEQGAKFKAGDDWSPQVLVDDNLVTAQNPASGGPCAAKVLELLA